MRTSNEVSVLVTTPPAIVERRLRRVEAWSCFLVDVHRIVKVADQRYVFEVAAGRQESEVRVAVREHEQERRFLWTALSGPSFDGTLRLSEVEGVWTRVTVSLDEEPIQGRKASAENAFSIDERRLVSFLSRSAD